MHVTNMNTITHTHTHRPSAKSATMDANAVFDRVTQTIHVVFMQVRVC